MLFFTTPAGLLFMAGFAITAGTFHLLRPDPDPVSAGVSFGFALLGLVLLVIISEALRRLEQDEKLASHPESHPDFLG